MNTGVESDSYLVHTIWMYLKKKNRYKKRTDAINVITGPPFQAK
jgi:hypothetical protein